MAYIDFAYSHILSDIRDGGVYKNTRSGEVRSLFDRTIRIDIPKQGYPLLTTKKMFTKGIIHELLWFLSGSTNIKYLVDNNVHIWDDDAYRWYLDMHRFYGYQNKLLTKELFIDFVKEGKKIDENYTYGDLGNVYGHQWRNWGNDQIVNIIDKLRTNPDDRRLILSAWNVGELDTMALPPCHVMYQFYSQPMTALERLDWLCEHSDTHKYDEWKTTTHAEMDRLKVPQRKLNCSFVCRSQDFVLGTPFNLFSASLLLTMIAQQSDHAVGELIWHGMDCHIYENQLDAVNEQLSRDTSRYKAPKVIVNPNVPSINDYKFEDFSILDYESYPTIKAPLSVG